MSNLDILNEKLKSFDLKVLSDSLFNFRKQGATKDQYIVEMEKISTGTKTEKMFYGIMDHTLYHGVGLGTAQIENAVLEQHRKWLIDNLDRLTK